MAQPPQRLVDYFVVAGVGATFEKLDVHHDVPLLPPPQLPPGSASPPLPQFSAVSPSVSPPRRDCWNTRFKGKDIIKVPHKDYSDAPVPANVWMFCFPNGIKLEKKPQRPKFSIFVLTNVDYTRCYAAALTAYRPHDTHPPLPSELADSEIKSKMYIPVAICILSHYPFFALFKEYLREIYRASRVLSPLSPETIIENLLFDIPLPPQGQVIVKSTLGTKTLLISRPSKSAYELADYDFRALFDALGVETVINIFSWILEERKVLFMSQHASFLTTAAETIMALLYPLQWQHVYIPVLSKSLLNFLQSPTPYIMGVVHEQDDPLFDLPDVIIVDLDSGAVHNDVPSILPIEMRDKLIKQLKSLLFPSVANIDAAFDTNDPLHYDYDEVPPPSEEPWADTNTRIRTIFLSFFVPLLCKYRSCIQFLRKYPKPIAVFDRPRFLSYQQPENLGFMQLLVQTQGWAQFLEKSNLQSENIFDLAVYYFLNKDTELEFITHNPIQTPPKQVYEVPPLLACGAPQKYDEFPKMSPAFLEKARPPTALTLAPEKPQMPYYTEEPIDSYSTQPYISKDFGQPQLERLDQVIDIVITAKNFNEKKQQLQWLSGLIGVAEGAVMFVSRLAQYTREKNPDICLSEPSFDFLSDALKHVLTVSNTFNDFRAPADLLKLVSIYYRKVGGLPEFLYTRLCTCDVWKNSSFWEFAFYKELQRRRSDLEQHFRTSLDDWDRIPSEKRNAVVTIEDDLLFKAIASFVLTMSVLAGDNQARHFISRISTQASLREDVIDQLNSFLKNASKANTEFASSLESVKTKETLRRQDGKKTQNYFTVVESQGKAQTREVYEKMLQACLHTSEPAGPAPRIEASRQEGYSVTTLQANVGPIDCIALQGHILASGSSMGRIALWDTDSMRHLAKMYGHTDRVSQVHFNNNGNDIVSSSWDKTLRIWDSTTTQCKNVLAGHSAAVSCCDVNSTFIVSGSQDSIVRVWDLRTSPFAAAELKGHQEPIRCIQLGQRSAKDASYVVLTGSEDKTLKLWDLRKLAPVYTLNEHKDWVRTVYFDSQKIYSGSYDCTVKMWDLKSGRCQKTFSGHQGSVNCLACDPPTHRVVSGSGDGTVRIWDSFSEKCTILIGHTMEVVSVAIVDDWIVTASFDQTVRIWDRGVCIKQLKGHTDWLTSIHATNRRIISASWDSTIKVWNLE